MSYGYGSIWGGTKEDNRSRLIIFVACAIIGSFFAVGFVAACHQDMDKMEVNQTTQNLYFIDDKPSSSVLTSQCSFENQHNPFVLGEIMFQAMYFEHTFKNMYTTQVVYDPEFNSYVGELVPKITPNYSRDRDTRAAVTGDPYYDSLEVETRSSLDSYKSNDIEYPSLDWVFGRIE